VGGRLRFYPDYTAYSALWEIADDGHELGLSHFEAELSPDLRERIHAWVRRWEWFTDEGPDDGGTPSEHEAWRVEGRRLLTEIQAALEPLGWRVENAFEGEPEQTLEI
jgi:hypothetical protein